MNLVVTDLLQGYDVILGDDVITHPPGDVITHPGPKARWTLYVHMQEKVSLPCSG